MPENQTLIRNWTNVSVRVAPTRNPSRSPDWNKRTYLVPVPSWKWGHISSGVIKYYYSSTKLNYTEAVAYCANHNSFLLEILTQDDLLYFENYLTSYETQETGKFFNQFFHQEFRNLWIVKLSLENSLKVKENSDRNITLPDVWLGHSLDRESNKWRQKSTGDIIEWKGWLDSCMIDKGMDSIIFDFKIRLQIGLGGPGSYNLG